MRFLLSNDIEDILEYSFSDASLLEEALLHPSISNKKKESGGSYNYERLEFLGDSVLGVIIAELLMNKYPLEKEGNLAKRHAALVRGESIALVGKKINVGKYIKMTQGEESMGGRENSNNIENALEAIIGAIYLDGGIDKAKEFITTHWVDLVDSMKTPPKEEKTALQEWAQARGFPIPEYKVIESKGPSHSPVFEVEVHVQGFDPVKASGESKKKAEKNAAKCVLSLINETD